MTRPAQHVFLVRHGGTLLNATGLLRGHLDPTLHAVGVMEAHELAEALSHWRPARILSSPLRRALQTAQPLAERIQRRVDIEPRLIDRDFGHWAGHVSTDVIARYGSIDEAPGVEARQAVTCRALAVLNEQLDRLRDGPIVLVTHQTVNQLLLYALAPELGDPADIRQRTGCWNVITRCANRWRVTQVDQRP